MARSLYDILDIPRDADEKAIKKAYRALAGKWHPDRNKDDPEAEKRFKEINRANEVLSDPAKRAVYDEFGEAAEQFGYDPEKAGAYRQWQSSGGFDGGVDLEDLLAQMFGGGGSPFGRGGPRRAPNQRASVTVDFATAILGGQRELRLPDGAVTVRIPPGTADGATLRLRGKGGAGPGGSRGDLLLEVRVAAHPDISRDGDDLRTTVSTTLATLLRGGPIAVPTLDGRIRLRVPAGTQPGAVLRARGKGVPRKDGTRGDLHVTVALRLPDVAGKDVDAAIDALEACYGPGDGE